jgi:hypothetical protein
VILLTTNETQRHSNICSHHTALTAKRIWPTQAKLFRDDTRIYETHWLFSFILLRLTKPLAAHSIGHKNQPDYYTFVRRRDTNIRVTFHDESPAIRPPTLCYFIISAYLFYPYLPRVSRCYIISLTSICGIIFVFICKLLLQFSFGHPVLSVTETGMS